MKAVSSCVAVQTNLSIHFTLMSSSSFPCVTSQIEC